jgi:branched-chain amino acid transport system ATP-binding protein
LTTGLDLLGARAGYGSVEVLHGVTMAFPTAAVTALIGRNGAGKSTVLRSLAGLLPLRSGTVCWDGLDVSTHSAFERSRAGMMLVPDEQGIFTTMTVRENMELVARGAPLTPALDVFGELRPRLDQQAGTLSGGEQQMLALSRAFLRPGRVILLDELSRGLSPGVTNRCYEAMADLVSPQRAIVIVEQYLEDVLRRATIVYVLARGEVAFAGEPSELEAGPQGV